jgi:hypothetical protein
LVSRTAPEDGERLVALTRLALLVFRGIAIRNLSFVDPAGGENG